MNKEFILKVLEDSIQKATGEMESIRDNLNAMAKERDKIRAEILEESKKTAEPRAKRKYVWRKKKK